MYLMSFMFIHWLYRASGKVEEQHLAVCKFLAPNAIGRCKLNLIPIVTLESFMFQSIVTNVPALCFLIFHLILVDQLIF